MNEEGLLAAATAIRSLAMDAVQKANSGHPGLPMGCAEVGALLYGEILSHYPGDPRWPNRDRFVLSAGHGSMLLYSLLHLSGYGLSLEDIKSFRQLGSKTPGHPEYWCSPGVETTTGPLGQGISNAVGMAIAEAMLAARLNTERRVIDHYTYVLAGDGDMMEGVSSEACSLAGHLGLGKLIVFYDSNRITIEGSTELAFTEDVPARFDAYGWHTQGGGAYDLPGMLAMVEAARKESGRPSLIVLSSVIAKGSPGKAGSHEAHGAPLGEEEVRATKRALGLPEDGEFTVPEAAKGYFRERQPAWKKRYEEWQELFQAWKKEKPGNGRLWEQFFGAPDLEGVRFPEFAEGEKQATRKSSGAVLNAIAEQIPNLVGGSADLAPSNNTELKGQGSFQAGNHAGRNLHFGVREHGMGAVASGICLHGGLRPYCGTFLVFSDYMRPSIRLAALMGQPVIYVFTHDSVYLGEDGPTHQPVEQLAALRAIPNLLVLRPGDAAETSVAWRIALEQTDRPAALALTRQNLTVYPKSDPHWRQTAAHGAYVVSESEGGGPRVVLVATGSEVNLALEAKRSLGEPRVRVVSMLSRELFLGSPASFRERLLPPQVPVVVLEIGVSLGWEGLACSGGLVYSLERFGESAPGAEAAKHLGFSADQVAARVRELLG